MERGSYSILIHLRVMSDWITPNFGTEYPAIYCRKLFYVNNYVEFCWMTYSFIQLAKLQLEMRLQKSIRMGIIILKTFIWGVYRQIFSRKSRFTALLVHRLEMPTLNGALQEYERHFSGIWGNFPECHIFRHKSTKCTCTSLM